MSRHQNVGEPLRSPSYAARLMTHLSSLIDTVPRKGISYEPVNLEDLVHPVCQWAWDEIAARNKLHKYAKHVRSSQTFAINLFGGLPESGVRTILEAFFGPIKDIAKPIFEFEDEQDRLRESVMNGQRTQVDVVLTGHHFDGRKVALLIEVKLTEDDFGNCSGFGDLTNDALHICNTSGPFGSDPGNCFKLRNGGGAERRTYDLYLPLTLLPDSDESDGCWYRDSAYQPMRNVALAAMLQREDNIETAVAVCAPLLHRKMWSHFRSACAVLPQGSLSPLPAELILALHDEETFSNLRDRYFIDIGEEFDVNEQIEIATWRVVESFDRQIDHPYILIESHPGGGQYDCITFAERVDGEMRPVVDLNRNGSVNIFVNGDVIRVDKGWERAINGQADTVATEIGHRLGLPFRQTPLRPVSRMYGRVIELGYRAGEALRWRIEDSEGTLHSDNVLNLAGHRLERYGRRYDDADLPKSVFASRAMLPKSTHNQML